MLYNIDWVDIVMLWSLLEVLRAFGSCVESRNFNFSAIQHFAAQHLWHQHIALQTVSPLTQVMNRSYEPVNALVLSARAGREREGEFGQLSPQPDSPFASLSDCESSSPEIT